MIFDLKDNPFLQLFFSSPTEKVHMRNTRTETIVAYNLDNGRRDQRVNREIAAILETNPLYLVGIEATGFDAHHDSRYWLIRDKSTLSRENILVYIRKNAQYRPGGWIDLHGTWPRTEYHGTHEPRSFPYFTVYGLLNAAVHLPPNNAINKDELQAECVKALTRLHPDITIGDFNGVKGERGRGKPDALAHAINARTVGQRIDCAVIRNDIRVKHVTYPTHYRHVELNSDHHHAVSIKIEIPKR